MTQRIRVAEAKARFSAIIDSVLYHDAHYVIERRGRAVAAIVPVNELERLTASGSDTTGRPAGALALLGAWSEVEDDAIDAFLDDVYEARARDTGRPVSIEPF